MCIAGGDVAFYAAPADFHRGSNFLKLHIVVVAHRQYLLFLKRQRIHCFVQTLIFILLQTARLRICIGGVILQNLKNFVISNVLKLV